MDMIKINLKVYNTNLNELLINQSIKCILWRERITDLGFDKYLYNK